MTWQRIGVLGWAIVACVTASATAGCGGRVEVASGGVTSAASSGSGGSAGSTSVGSGGGGPAFSTMAACVPGAPAVAVALFPSDEDAYEPAGGILVDETYVYWVGEPDGVFRAPKAGGTLVLIPGTAGVPRNGLAADEDGLYICMPPAGEGPSDLVRTAKDGSAPVTLATGDACFAVGVAGDDVFWAASEGIMRADKTTGAGPTLLAGGDAIAGGSPWEFVVGNAGVWWMQLDADGSGASSLFAVDQGGGPVTTVAGHDFGLNVAVGGAYAYWDTSFPADTAGLFRADAPGALPTLVGAPYGVLAADASDVYTVLTIGVVKVPGSGGAPVVLASEAHAGDGFLAVDESCVYWLDVAEQMIMKISKGTP